MDANHTPKRRHLASVWAAPGDSAWTVAESPQEVLQIVQAALHSQWQNGAPQWVTLTLSHRDSDWDGRPVYLRADTITAMAPPMNLGEPSE